MKIKWIKHTPEIFSNLFLITYKTWWGSTKKRFAFLYSNQFDSKVLWSDTGKLVQYNQEILVNWCKSVMK